MLHQLQYRCVARLSVVRSIVASSRRTYSSRPHGNLFRVEDGKRLESALHSLPSSDERWDEYAGLLPRRIAGIVGDEDLDLAELPSYIDVLDQFLSRMTYPHELGHGWTIGRRNVHEQLFNWTDEDVFQYPATALVSVNPSAPGMKQFVEIRWKDRQLRCLEAKEGQFRGNVRVSSCSHTIPSHWLLKMKTVEWPKRASTMPCFSAALATPDKQPGENPFLRACTFDRPSHPDWLKPNRFRATDEQIRNDSDAWATYLEEKSR